MTCLMLCWAVIAAQERASADVVVYGGTSAGVAAAVQVARSGKRVVLVEPSRHVGGLSSGGLGMTDTGDHRAIGGISREFYRRLKRHYDDEAAWKFERRADYKLASAADDAFWRFEPHVAEKVFRAMLDEAKVSVVYGERLDLARGVRKEGARIVSIAMESGRAFAGRVFIDATYEGDLMAKAGVRYAVGRESNAEYGETLNGVQTRNARSHQFVTPVDPFVRPGDPSSGLLPRIHAEGPGPEGGADRRVQAYCYRLCMTDAPENRAPWPKPDDYDELQYELLLRAFESGDLRVPWKPDRVPNRKTDTNNNFAFSLDNIGMNYDYPDGDYAVRARILKEHESYQKGLMWTLAHHPRVPAKVREEVGRWGLARDEFTDNGNWPHQIYVREARRMVSDYVMTEHDCRRTRATPESVGMGSYNMDSHHVQRYVDASGHARNEGDVQVSPGGPYMISYRSIRPKAQECENLLVPVCLSSSHIAYGSIRMEPVFMILGQSAAAAAILAIEEGVSVQRVDTAKLRARLLADGQVLEPPAPRGIDPKGLEGVVVDDDAAKLTGAWISSAAVEGFVGARYWHDNNEGKGAKSARFEAKLARAGRYEVRLAYTPNPNRATNVPVTVEHAGGARTIAVDQRKPPPIARAFVSLGTFEFGEAPAAVVVSTRDTDGHVIVDAVQFVPAP